MDISSWGAPVASYPSATCDMLQHFQPQELVIDITFCGNWCALLPLHGPASDCNSQGGDPERLCRNLRWAARHRGTVSNWHLLRASNLFRCLARIALFTAAALA